MDSGSWRRWTTTLWERVRHWARVHPFWVAFSVIAVLLAVTLVLLSAGTAGAGEIPSFRDFKVGEGTDLVVVVHGLAGSAERMSGVIEEAKAAYPDAEFLVPEFPAGSFSNADAALISHRIELEIFNRDRRRAGTGRPYRRIVLVGHSIGALLIRKAYVWGHGGELSVDRPVASQPHRPWVDRVDRLVLLAGMNRGWSTSGKVDELGCKPIRYHRRLFFWLGKRVARLTGTGKLILATERGAPFVADLRVQWIRLARPARARSPLGEEMPASPSTVAPVVQLLGDIDDVVTHCDQQDVAVAKDFYFVPVRWTNHSGIIEVGSEAPAGLPGHVAPEREARLREAFTWPIEQLRHEYGHRVEGEDPDVNHVVFVMHGIRDYGGWTARIASAMTNQDRRRGSVVVVPSSYGYFPMGSFLLLRQRQKNVRWFMDQYTQVVAQYPYAKVSYVGHSNGTYLLASALERYSTLRVHRVFFAGSVVRSGYRWDRFYRGREPRVGEVRNVVASRDMVVGIFPRFFELVTEHTPVSSRGFFDLGAAGFRGFSERQINLEFAKGGHAAALDEEAELQAIAQYVLGDSESSSRQQALSVFVQARDPAWFANWTSKLCWLIWLALLAIVVFFGRLFHLWVRQRWPRLGRVGWGIYVLLLLAILQTV